MRPLSPTEAVAPALRHTKLVLFSPFRFGRSWKLAATGYLSIMGGAFYPWPLVYLFAIPLLERQPHPAFLHSMIYCMTAVMMAIYLGLFYIFCRLRFAFFDIVLLREQFVAPAWGRHGQATKRWLAAAIVLGLAFTAVIAPIAAHTMRQFAELGAASDGSVRALPNFALLLKQEAVFLMLYLIVGLCVWLSSLVADFVLPPLALENVTLGEAFRRFGSLIASEPAMLSLYALLKLGMAIVAFVAAAIAFYIAVIIVVLVVLAAGALLHLLHVPTGLLIALGVLIAFPLYLCATLYLPMLANGSVATFLEAYLQYFLGGRYPLLGQYLDPLVAPEAYPYFSTPPTA